MTVLAFTVPGDPVPKERPRLGRDGNVYTPRATKDAERAIGEWFKATNPGADPLTVPVSVTMTFRCAPRDVRVGKGRHQDIDNLQKTVLDALNRIAWTDDALVVTVVARVIRGSDDPGTDVRIEEAG